MTRGKPKRPVRATAPKPKPSATVPSAAAGPELPPAAVDDRGSNRRRRPLLWAAGAVLLLAVIGFVGGQMLDADDPLAGVVVGEPSGEVFESTPDPTTAPTRRPTAEPTAEPTVQPTLAPTPAPAAAATPAPDAPAPPVMVAVAITPDQTVGAWYSHVVNGDFDAAYGLWSDRMRAGFPREGNLDNRWRDTADVSFTQLYVVEQTQTTATVQVEFVETKDNGSSRRFIGWWELVRSGDGWLLDQPHF